MNDMGKQITYQELLAAYNKLLMENEFLHKEVDRLQALLNSKDIPMTQPIMKQHLSLEEKVSVLENQVTSQCAGMNGTGNCVTRKSISAQNVPTGCSNR